MSDCVPDLTSLLNYITEVEDKISGLRAILDAHNVGMNEELVDKEGFPRNDININAIRETRLELIKAQNDYTSLMEKRDEIILKYHALPELKDKSAQQQPLTQFVKKIATVGKVEKDSPSEYAGLKEGDEVLEFGRVNAVNMKAICDVNKQVLESINMYFKVIVRRDGNLKRLNLKPKPWSGKGYLGCILIPSL